MDTYINLREALQTEYDKGYQDGLKKSKERQEEVRNSAYIQSFNRTDYSVGEWCEDVLRQCFIMCQEFVPLEENSAVHALAVLSSKAFYMGESEKWNKNDWIKVRETLGSVGGKGNI